MNQLLKVNRKLFLRRCVQIKSCTWPVFGCHILRMPRIMMIMMTIRLSTLDTFDGGNAESEITIGCIMRCPQTSGHSADAVGLGIFPTANTPKL